MRYKYSDKEKRTCRTWVGFLFFSYTFLVILGNLNLRSAVFLSRFERLGSIQFTWSLLGIGSCVFFGFFLPKIPWKWVAVVGIPCVFFSMMGLRWFGDTVGGARRWFETPFGSIQPSELAKPVWVIGISFILSSMSIRILGLVVSGFLALGVAFLVFLEPDLGTSLIFLFMWVVMGFFYVRRLFRFFGILIIMGMIGLSVGLPQLKEYQWLRLRAFIQPHAHPDTYYHTQQSKILVGSGGLTGSGYMRGEGNIYGFIPTDHTDFVLSVYAEEWGWFGMLVFLGLWLLFLFALIKLIGFSEGRGKYLLVGVYSIFFFQFLMNTAMVLGVAPVTGIPSPFFSYGGSSMLTSSILVGLSTHVALNPEEPGER